MNKTGSALARNISVGGKWGEFLDKADEKVAFQDNLLDQDPQFVDAEHGDFRLKDDSPALKSGFEQLPFEKMGLYASPDRASWPVQHAVRPTATPAQPK